MKHTIRSLFAASALALAGACGGGNEQRAPDTPVAREVDSTEALAFMAAVDQSEVQTAQLGTRRAASAEVRRFAQLMWREHAQSGRDVAELARQMEIDLRAAAPQSPMIANLRSMTQQTTQLLDRTPRGAEFDRAYVASLAPGGGVDVGVTGRVDAADSAAAARRAVNRTPENAEQGVRLMLARVQQHLDSARRVQAWLGGAGR